MNQNGRPWYFWPLIAFIVGFLIGWLVLGWGLWPVKWTNALLPDLRTDLRNQYIAMVAESYAQTGNLEQARARLAEWTPADLARAMSDLQEVLVVQDVAAARNVQNLAAALDVDMSEPGAPSGQSTVQTQTPATPSAPATGTTSALRRICTAGLFVFLAIGALVLLFLLFRRWRSTHAESGPGPNESSFDAPETASAAALAAEQEKARWAPKESGGKDDRRPVPGSADASTRLGWEGSSGSESRSLSQQERSDIPLRPLGPTPLSTSSWEPRQPTQPFPTPPPSSSSGTLQKLTENVAIYQMGEPDYDEAFDINDPVDGYMGQSGLQMVEAYGRERDQAVALQVWLWDSSDPDTPQVLVLMSEGAYRDTSLRSEYEGEHGAVAVKPGTEFELGSRDLLLRGRVEKVSYAEAEPPRGIFAELHVKLTVYRQS